MNLEDLYLERLDKAAQEAGAYDSLWNARYIDALDKLDLKLSWAREYMPGGYPGDGFPAQAPLPVFGVYDWQLKGAYVVWKEEAGLFGLNHDTH